MFDRLEKGDKIGIFTPSSPGTVTAFQRFPRAKVFMEEKGLVIVEGELNVEHKIYVCYNTNVRFILLWVEDEK